MADRVPIHLQTQPGSIGVSNTQPSEEGRQGLTAQTAASCALKFAWGFSFDASQYASDPS